MNTTLNRTLLAIGGAAAITLGAMSFASAGSNQNFIEENWLNGGPTAGTNSGGADTGGANLALPGTMGGSSSCTDILAAPGRFSQDQVASCGGDTHTHTGAGSSNNRTATPL